MNYGKFFRLNQRTSKIEEGVAIYDYIDLPAYFEASESNEMSPKYPISVTITEDSVRFRVHYSAYKCKHEHKNIDIESYSYKVDEVFKRDSKSTLRHMEEVLIELNFSNDSTDELYQTIKALYYTKYPYLLLEKPSDRETGNNKEATNEEKTTFIHSLIQKRYDGDNTEPIYNNDIEKDLYQMLRENQDRDPSYSTLWLMDIISNNKKNSINLFEGGIVVKFLRKLLLDFMFDLKHSDVFQTSKYYQKMYSGLMSDFYFSALMHKCEYYYYRKITSQSIEEKDRTSSLTKGKDDRVKAITILYANELVKAEDLWIRDIMNPLAEKHFEHQYPGKHNVLRDILEYYNFKQWPSWFAEPEEEMRRVCFTMKDNSGVRHICNADTLIRYLKLDIDSEDRTIKKIIDVRDEGKELISRWFLKHYAFSDVLHLHFFKHANILFLSLFALPSLIYLTSKNIIIPCVWIGVVLLLWGSILLSMRFYKVAVCRSCGIHATCKDMRNSLNQAIGIVGARRNLVIRTVIRSFVFICLLFLLILLGLLHFVNKFVADIPSAFYYIAVTTTVLIILIQSHRAQPFYKAIISNLHLFLPRLVASISLAWITLSMGFDLYVSYFDAPPRADYIVGICVIVSLFVMYSINLVIPHSPPLRKLLRTFNLMIVSYFISLAVGFVIINFLGEKYLERGGYISDYYNQHIDNNNWVESRENDSKSLILNDSSWQSYAKEIIRRLNEIDNPNDLSHVEKVKNLKDIKMRTNYKVATKVPFWGRDYFILGDFLVMFAFIAMFTGIFIQLIIFGDNKQMTEL